MGCSVDLTSLISGFMEPVTLAWPRCPAAVTKTNTSISACCGACYSVPPPSQIQTHTFFTLWSLSLHPTIVTNINTSISTHCGACYTVQLLTQIQTSISAQYGACYSAKLRSQIEISISAHYGASHVVLAPVLALKNNCYLCKW